MNPKESLATTSTALYTYSNNAKLLQVISVTLIFLFIVYLVCFLRVDLSFLDIFSLVLPASNSHSTPCYTPKFTNNVSNEVYPKSPKSHFILTAQCMLFAFVPLYANMLFALVRFKDETKEIVKNNFTCSFKCSLNNATKETLNKSLNQLRSIMKKMNLEKKTEGYASRGKRPKVELTRDESLESLSTYCETPLINNESPIRLLASPITPFIAEPNTVIAFPLNSIGK